MFPASLINSCHPPPPPPTLPASLTPYPLACLPHCLPHFPTSFTHSIPPSPWLSYITLCLTDSPVSLPLPHSLPHSLSHSLPYIALPHPIPSHSPASLIHIFFTQSLPHYPLTHSCPTLSLNHSLPSTTIQTPYFSYRRWHPSIPKFLQMQGSEWDGEWGSERGRVSETGESVRQSDVGEWMRQGEGGREGVKELGKCGKQWGRQVRW